MPNCRAAADPWWELSSDQYYPHYPGGNYYPGGNFYLGGNFYPGENYYLGGNFYPGGNYYHPRWESLSGWEGKQSEPGTVPIRFRCDCGHENDGHDNCEGHDIGHGHDKHNEQNHNTA